LKPTTSSTRSVYFNKNILERSLFLFTNKKKKDSDALIPVSFWFYPVKNIMDEIENNNYDTDIDLLDGRVIVNWLSIPIIKNCSDIKSPFFSTKKGLFIILFRKLFTFYNYNRIFENLFFQIGDNCLPLVGCCYPFEKENEYFHTDFESLSFEKNILLKNYIWLGLRELAENVYKKYPPFLYEPTPFPIVIEDEFKICSLP